MSWHAICAGTPSGQRRVKYKGRMRGRAGVSLTHFFGERLHGAGEVRCAGHQRRHRSGACRLGSARSSGAVTGTERDLFLSLVPCIRKRSLFACVTGSWGELRADRSRSATARYVAVGARVGFDFPVARQLSLRTHFDGAAPLDRTIVQVNGKTAWQLPAFSGALGLEASLRFP